MKQLDQSSGNVHVLPTTQALYNKYIADQQLTPENLTANHIRLVEVNSDLQKELGIPNSHCPAVMYPYYATDGAMLPLASARCRLLKPLADQKYWQLPGTGDLGPFLPQGSWDWSSVFANVAQPLMFIEGEVKSIVSGNYLPAIPIVAIGGVWNFKTLLNRTDIEWRNRPVIVCFDHDDGQEPGKYNPNVTLALSRFCEALIMQGAVVSVVHLGPLAEKQGITGKVGLDDYFRKGGKAEMLLDNLSPPPQGCELLAAMFDRYVVVNLPRPVVWDRNTTNVYTFGAFKELHANKWRMDSSGNGSTARKRKVYVAVEFLERHDRPEATKFTIDPTKPAGYLAEAQVINLWEPFKVWDSALVKQESKEAFDKLGATLCGEHWSSVRQWLACYVRHPEQRTSQAVLLATSLTGIGKSLLGEVIGHVVGEAHSTEASLDDIHGKFNADMERMTWVIVNEVNARFNFDGEKFKATITNKSFKVEHKGGAKYDVDNRRRFWLSSNLTVAMRLGAYNRRIWVCYPSVYESNKDEWKAWLKGVTDAYDHGNGEAFLASVRAYLDEVDLAGYDPMDDVVNGEAARELEANSRSATETAAATIMDMWAESGEAVLVYTAAQRQQHSEVILHLDNMCHQRQLTKVMKQIKEGGKVITYYLHGNFKPGEVQVDAAYNRKYVGDVPNKDWVLAWVRQGQWFASATEHLR